MTPAILVDHVPTTIAFNASPRNIPRRRKTLKSTWNEIRPLPTEFYNLYLSDSAKSRKQNPIRGLFPFEQRPGMISMLAGKPNPTCFPITSLQVSTRSATDPTKETIIDISGSALEEGQQYGDAAGMPSLMNWITGLQEYFHGRKTREGWRVSIGCGSQDLLYKAFHALVNPGEAVLIESPVYAAILPLLEELKAELIVIETDGQGLIPSSLQNVLENWPTTKPLPKVLYTVPFGSNPTGTTIPIERRREVLELSRKYSFLILEDDPYYYLYYGKAVRPPSYFSLELEQPEVGRVVRFDSMSKILSAGMRIGFVSGPTSIVTAMDTHTATANLQVPSLTQVIARTILESWGYDGFKRHTDSVSQFYRQKRDVFECAMRRNLTGLAEWTTPEAGMFYWFKLLLNDPSEPISADVEEDSEEVIRTKALERGVLALPGTVFLPGGNKTAYVRASFSLLDEETVEEAIKRLASVVIEARKH